MAHPKEKLVEAAGKAIINMVVGRKGYYGLKIKPELIVRESTKKLFERKVEVNG